MIATDPKRLQRIAGATAAVLFAAAAVEWLLVYNLARLGALDGGLYEQFIAFDNRTVNGLANLVAGLCDPGPFDYLAVVPVAVALLRRRLRLALSLPLLMLCAIATTELLKPLLAAPHPGVTGLPPLAPGSWPSGHSTAATALAWTLVIAAPSRLRPYAAALGTSFSLAVVYAVLVLGWHYPSDALGGILVASGWAAVAVFALARLECRHPTRRARRPVLSPRVRRLLTRPVLSTATVLAGLLAVLTVRPAATVAFVSAHHLLVAATGTLALLSSGVAAALVLALRR